ncbi:MAG TPA: CHAT domain-containing protein [Acetobacteraceae bacterium]|nr:CHAT domain-containing protein [Acetobacteraceae bacterium]
MATLLNCERSHISLVGGTLDRRRPLATAPLSTLNRRYALAREKGDRDALVEIGRDLYRWLDGDEGWLSELRQQQPRPFVLEVRGPLEPNAAEWQVLQAPWELLADGSGFLALDTELRYAPARRLGKPNAPAPLDDYRLGVAFMAAAPRGQQELDFEAEEAAIMAAAGENLDLFVEESGNAEELGRRLAFLRPPLPVLHLSCHGHNAWRGRDGKDAPQPVLLLEDATGSNAPTTAGLLFDALGKYRPRLLFLSACLTAAGGRDAATAGALSDSLASRIVRDIPAVLGWDGSVADVAATAFARELYDDLDKGVDLPLAAASARRALLNASGVPDSDSRAETEFQRRLRAEANALRRDWHLARVWLGAEGGGPVVDGAFARSLTPPGGGHKVVLAARGDEKLEVADPAMFVGRRRELQRSLRALGSREKAGLLLHGMGRLGKSSLAARVIDRRPDLTPAVVFGAYDALSVVDVLARALEEHEPAAKLLAERRPLVREDAAALRPLLVALLAGPCRSARDGRPLLLLVDDLERILVPGPDGNRHQVRAGERPVLAALLHAFDPRRSDSRLLLTSRFAFSLIEGGNDLAEQKLVALELGEFGERAREKLSLRQIRVAQAAQDGDALTGAALDERLALLTRAQAVARGNPGLQDLLGADLALRPAVPAAAAEAALEEMERYLSGGDLPQAEAVREFLQNLALDALLDLAGASGQALLRAATVFAAPVPEAVIAALAGAVGGDPRRLQDLGLLVPSEDLVRPREFGLSVNGLAAGRLPALAENEEAELARLALPVLFPLWGGVEDRLGRSYTADLVVTLLALKANDAAVLAACGADAVRGLADSGRPDPAGRLGEQAVAALEAGGQAPPLRLLARTADALQTAGHGAAADAVLAKGNTAIATDDAVELGQLSNYLFARGQRQMQAGDLDGAERTFGQLCELEARRKNDHQYAVARGAVADILVARGELDEALRIRNEKELPVYTRLGDIREMAVTQGKIADILLARGELDEALRILDQECLPAFTHLGEIRSISEVRARIAKILARQGRPDEAIAMQEERLATHRRLGDVEGIAGSLWDIAQIELQREHFDQAFPRLAEAWAILERIGRAEGIAVVGRRFGRILATGGQTDDARVVLSRSADAFHKLGRDAEARQVEALIRDLGSQE